MKPTPMPRTSDQIVGEYLLSVEGVKAKVSLGKTTLMAMVAAGTFPQPKLIGKVLRWRGSDVDGWIRDEFRSLLVVKAQAPRGPGRCEAPGH